MSSNNINALLHSVPKLHGPMDYHNWKFAIGMVLRRAGSYDIVTGKLAKTAENAKDWEAKADEALSIIGLTISTTQYGHIRDSTDGPEAWKALADIYEKDSRAMRISLKRQIYGYKHDPNAPMQDYISVITDLAAHLSALSKDNKLSATDIMDILIFNLDESYSNIAASLTAVKGSLSIADVTGSLLDEEGRRLGTKGRNDPEDLSPIETAALVKVAKEFTCFNCGKPGHIARNCHAPKRDHEKETAQATWENDDHLEIW